MGVDACVPRIYAAWLEVVTEAEKYPYSLLIPVARRTESLRGILDFAKLGERSGFGLSSETSRIGGFQTVNDAFPGGVEHAGLAGQYGRAVAADDALGRAAAVGQVHREFVSAGLVHAHPPVDPAAPVVAPRPGSTPITTPRVSAKPVWYCTRTTAGR